VYQTSFADWSECRLMPPQAMHLFSQLLIGESNKKLSVWSSFSNDNLNSVHFIHIIKTEFLQKARCSDKPDVSVGKKLAKRKYLPRLIQHHFIAARTTRFY
jgi:hypothetical protein